jgi:hypothetical protein
MQHEISHMLGAQRNGLNHAGINMQDSTAKTDPSAAPTIRPTLMNCWIGINPRT